MDVSYISSRNILEHQRSESGFVLMNFFNHRSPSEEQAAELASLEEAFSVFEYHEEHLLDGSLLLDVHSR